MSAAVPSTFTLSNAYYDVGISLSSGGAISSIKLANTSFNFVNTWDAGRLIQQSYYGDADGSFWNKNPWVYNPVQGGCWKDTKSTVTATSKSQNQFNVTTIPMNWGACTPCPEATMYSSYTLKDDIIAISFSMNYTGMSGKRARHQELPAVFVDRTLSRLAFYNGSKPWTNDTLQVISPVLLGPGVANDYARPTEKWAAYFNPATKIGLGVFTPTSTLLTAYRVGRKDTNPARSDTSYLAPLITDKLVEGRQYGYTTYIKIGTLDEIRAAFAKLK